MSDRVTISVPEDAYEEAKAAKGDRTWAGVLLDGAQADTTAGRDDEGQDEPMPDALTADDVPMLRREIADELEHRMTRR